MELDPLADKGSKCMLCARAFKVRDSSSNVTVTVTITVIVIVTVLVADQFKAIHDEGMPQYQRPFTKGSLYVHFNVEFPEPGSLNLEQIKVSRRSPFLFQSALVAWSFSWGDQTSWNVFQSALVEWSF